MRSSSFGMRTSSESGEPIADEGALPALDHSCSRNPASSSRGLAFLPAANDCYSPWTRHSLSPSLPVRSHSLSLAHTRDPSLNHMNLYSPLVPRLDSFDRRKGFYACRHKKQVVFQLIVWLGRADGSFNTSNCRIQMSKWTGA